MILNRPAKVRSYYSVCSSRRISYEQIKLTKCPTLISTLFLTVVGSAAVNRELKGNYFGVKR